MMGAGIEDLMKQTLLVAVSAATIFWSAGLNQAQAQTAQDVAVGDRVDAVLDGDDTRASGSETYVYEDYRLRLKAEQAVQIELLADGNFDAYLEVYRAGETRGAALYSDDDGGEGTDALVRFIADRDGDYIIRARNFSGEEGGAYQLAVSERQPHPYPQPQAIRVGDEKSGNLSDKDATDEGGTPMQLYGWRARSGDRVAILLESDDFDPVVTIGQLKNGFFDQLARNDDGAGHGLNAYQVFTAPQAGEYLIQVQSVGGQGTGRYKLSLEEGPKAAQITPLRVGETVSGALGEDSGTGNSGVRADQYRLRGKEGDRIAFSMDSDEFDTYLELFDANMQSLATDDDSGGELNARLVHVLPADGDYIIEARGYGDAEGPYDLRASIVAAPPAPTPIRFGQTVQGELKENGPEDDGGNLFGGYRFTGTKGQRIQATMRSGDLDAYLELGEAGDEFTALASDDDGLRQGTDARLNFTLPEDGEYVLRARGYSRDQKGLYSLELSDRGPEPGTGSLLVPSVVRSSLSDLDALTDEGIAFDAYSFKAKSGDKLRFTLISSSFDAVVEVGEDKNGSWRSLKSDDDGLSDNHSRLDWTAPRDGTFILRARSYAPASTGSYVLTVERQP